MIVTLIHVWVKNAFVNDFAEAIRENQKHTLKEPGNIRFDILQEEENPAKFVLFEVFKDEEAITEHKKTNHYLVWRDKVVDWMEQPRKGIKYLWLVND